MTPAGRVPLAAATAAALTRALLRLYPRGFRREVGDAVLGDVRRRAAELAATHGSIRVGCWLVALGLSLVANGLAAWGERILPRRSAFSWLDFKLALRMLIHRLHRTGIVTATAAVGVGLFSVLLLSAAGIYALMSFTVTERRREIAIRTALGAQPGQLLGGIFRRALKQIAIGVAFGVGIALLLDVIEQGEALQGYRAVLLIGMIAIMSLIGSLAAFGPARRGLRIAPQEALKAE